MSLYANVGTAQPQDQKKVQQTLPTLGDQQPGGTAPTSAPQAQTRPGTSAPAAPNPMQPTTFRTMQQAGVARPAPGAPQAPWGFQMPQAQQPVPQQQWADLQPRPQQPQMPQQPGGGFGGAAGGFQQTQQFSGGGGSVPGLQALLQKMIAQPTNYDDSVIQAQRTAMQGNIGDQYDMDKAKLDEEMAARGIFGSSIAGGRLGDLMIQKNRALQNEEAGFLNNRAQAMDAGQRSAAGLGMQYDDMQFGQGLGAFNANLNARGMDQDNAYRYANLGENRRQFDQGFGLDTQRFGEDTRRYDQDFGENRNRWGQEFGWNQQRDARDFGEDSRRYNQDFTDSRSRFDQNFGEDQRRYNQDFGEDTRRWDKNFGFQEKDWDWNAMRDLLGDYSGADLTEVYDPMNPEQGGGYGGPNVMPYDPAWAEELRGY